MSRITLGEVSPEQNPNPTPRNLDVLIPQYARQKEDFDDLKKRLTRITLLSKT